MADEIKLKNPWLVAVWPGMGNVAISAGYYLMAKLGMHLLAEFPARELFDVDHVDVKDGLIQPGRLPQSRFFVWNDPRGQHDLVVFIGEAQPPMGRIRLLSPADRVCQGPGRGTGLHVRGPGDPDASRQSCSRLRRRHRCRMPGRAEATGTADDRRRPDRRSERRAARCGRREWPARGLPAGRDAAYLRPGSLPEGRRWRFSKRLDRWPISRSISPSSPSKPGTWIRSSANCWCKCNRRSNNRRRRRKTSADESVEPDEGPASIETTSRASNGSLSKPSKTAPPPTSSSASWTGSVSSRSTRIGSSTCSRNANEQDPSCQTVIVVRSASRTICGSSGG